MQSNAELQFVDSRQNCRYAPSCGLTFSKPAEAHKRGKLTKHLRQELIVHLTLSRRRFFSLVAFVLAPLVAFGFLEGALRVSGFGYGTVIE